MIKELNLSAINKLFDGLKGSWDNRAVVRNKILDYELDYDLDMPDFMEDLLPFKNHPLYEDSSQAVKSKILSCGWLIYNEKTVNIETKIISPACINIIDKKFDLFLAENIRENIAQVLTDESYHTLMVIKANALTMKKRQLAPFRFPDFDLVSNMQTMLGNLNCSKDKMLLGLACAIVSEMSISDYLSKLSKESSIQELNRQVIYAHWKDELSHASAFKKILEMAYCGFSKKEIDSLIKYINVARAWFESSELNVWRSVLLQIGFLSCEKMLNECQNEVRDANNKIFWNYSEIEDVIQRL